MSSTANTWIDTLQSFESLLLSRCYRHVTWKHILATVLKQELFYGETKARTWSQEYQEKTSIIFNKTNNNNKGQSLIRKTENLLDIIYDNFDCPLFASRGFREFQKRKPIFTT